MAKLSHLVLVWILFAVALPARAQDAVATLSQARQQCGARTPFRPQPALDDAARRLAQGVPLAQALQAAGYRALRSAQVSLAGYGSTAAVAQVLGQKHCSTVGSAELVDLGVLRQGDRWWVVAAAPFAPPAAAQAGDVAQRVLALVNQARGAPRRCGGQDFGAAPPLALAEPLTRAAQVHAQSMATYGYLEHRGRDGSSPAERAGRAGYDWRSIGENIAMGQPTPEQVVRDWLASPEHCANIMEPRFTQMGLAYAVNQASEGGIYWAQSLGRPR